MQKIDELSLQNKMSSTDYLVGLRQVVKHLEKFGDSLGCVVVASDAEQQIKTIVEDLCQKHKVELLEFESKARLGELAKIKVDCAVLGLK